MMTDIEIAQEAVMEPITKVAASIGLTEDDIELYGKYKAKLSEDLWNRIKNEKDGKLVINKKMVGRDAGKILNEIGIDADPRLIICETDAKHPFVQVEMMMPILAIVRVNDIDEAIKMALKYRDCFGEGNYFLELQDHTLLILYR